MPARTALVLKRALSLAFCVSFLGASCGQTALSVMPGVVNSTGNLSLRRAILSFGTNQICSEMLRRSVLLRLREEDPGTGRFFPTSCYVQDMSNQNLFVQFGGYGYLWANLTKRVGFDASAGVEYEPDFRMDGSTMYVYFRQKSTPASKFTTRFVEQPTPAVVSALPVPVPGGPISNAEMLNTFGPQLLKSELARGFTVIRESDGTVQFGVGIVQKGERPQVPFTITPSGRMVLVNERTEVHQSQRDFVGPIEVKSKGQALYLTAAVDGAAGADVILVPKAIGDAWLQTYTTQAALTPPPAYPTLDDQVFAGMMWRRTVPLPAGLYYVVLDNSSAAGRTHPPNVAGDDRAAMISVAIELGDAP
jgi:hypothetical protein